MPKLVVSGGRRLSGELNICGSKNAVLPVLAAVILFDNVVTITNYPKISDLYNMLNILEHVGCIIEEQEDRLVIDPRGATDWRMILSPVKEIRSSIFLLGPMLGRFKRAKFTYPGGCDIGLRPIDLHLFGLRRLNVSVTEGGGYIDCSCTQLTGATVELNYPSVGATENIMMAAVKAEGTTTIINAAREPEIVELQNFLNSAGAEISGAGTGVITVNGVKQLKAAEYVCVGDRIVTGTYALVAVATRGELLLRNVVCAHNAQLISKLKDAGVTIEEGTDTLYINAKNGADELSLTETAPYPGFPTDLQPQLCAVAATAGGTSVIVENVFENRFKHIGELKKMGANIVLKNNVAIIKGVKSLSPAMLTAYDLRGAAALVIAALNAKGESVISNVSYLARGYENIESELLSVGAKIKREN